MDIESGKKLLDEKLSYETTFAIVKKMEELNLHIQIYGENGYYCNMDDDALKWYEKAVGVKAIVINDVPMSVFIKKNRFQSYKVLAMVRPEDNAKTMEIFNSCRFEGCKVTKSADVLIEIINDKYSKGTAVQYLSKHYNVPLDNVIAIGDQWNDLDMVSVAGFGVAVQNADEALKKQAKLVCAYTNNENAVGKIIKEYAYKE